MDLMILKVSYLNNSMMSRIAATFKECDILQQKSELLTTAELRSKYSANF